jgi:hypothetical protein
VFSHLNESTVHILATSSSIGHGGVSESGEVSKVKIDIVKINGSVRLSPYSQTSHISWLTIKLKSAIHLVIGVEVSSRSPNLSVLHEFLAVP